MSEKTKNILYAIAIPIGLAISLRFGFGMRYMEGILGVMTATFLVLLPFLVGVFSILLSKSDKIQKKSYQFFFPWLSIMGFFAITIALSIEGWACWIMMMPVFLIIAGLGGFFGSYLRKTKKNNTLNMSILLLLPFLIAPIENQFFVSKDSFKVSTEITVKAANASQIWKHITRVKTIDEADDKSGLTRFLGFPRPIRAELDKVGVGGKRMAIFDKGLVFEEVVTHYEHEKRMRFTIDADPQKIPSTTLDEHVVIGGKYFDVLIGEYRLISLENGNYRIELDSEYQLNTAFNRYASLWASAIMRDIQDNILQVLEKRVGEEQE